MIKKWLGRVLPGRKPGKKTHERILAAAEHRISPHELSFAAEKVIKRLQQEGYEAYIVGGAVRDLLLGIKPKDFDVATDATPEQVRKIFRRSRIIGKRFPIVHVMVGPETIEVTTFRGGSVSNHNADGRIMKDAAFGNRLQDAERRDFTANALYYDPIRNIVADSHNGVADIAARRLVMIGDPAERYREDPVRMLRAARLAGKLGFEIDNATAAPVAGMAALLTHEPPARLFDEILKIIFSGQAEACLRQTEALGLGRGIHPLLDAMVDGIKMETGSTISDALAKTDLRLQQGEPVSAGFVMAAVFWPRVKEAWLQEQAAGLRPAAALNAAIHAVREKTEKRGIPQRYSTVMREIWMLQPQFLQRKGARPYKLASQPRFRAALDFLLLRTKDDGIPEELGTWWLAFRDADELQRARLIDDAPKGDIPAAKKRRRKPRKKPADTGESAS